MMNRFLLVIVAIVAMLSSANAFTPSASTAFLGSTRVASVVKQSNSQLNMIFGPPKDDGKPGDYVCMDCGYVFTKGPKAWAALPNDWSCPPCGSLKRRFKKVPKGSAGK